MSNQGSSSGSVFVAFAVGALVGAAVALLYAPSAGEETRRKLARKARESRDTIGSAVETAVERGREVYEQVRKEMA